ncbi:alpha-1,3/1,6-mannosyltransferase Alg2 [Arctopsyche grandis]|uniref:alpha-1,3/1,6-mannosyltransferase Alg2 n=1 Tax=Arctopsyche grandis TaxID=121162 RepID=UPI00406D7190
MVKVIFLHPDLGIGGAERLVLDAALALTTKGHQVSFYTNHHDPQHCFKETRDGTLSVNVVGSWIPRSAFGRCRALFAYLRFAYAALYLAWFVIPKEKPDAVFCDLISLCVPLLKLAKTQFKVVFYCHYPDKLLTNHDGILKKIYRAPIDWMEEISIKQADKILVNSKFTAEVFRQSFQSINVAPDICYPSINTNYFDSTSPKPISDVINIPNDTFLLLSINRYERKKNLALALNCLNDLRSNLGSEEWKKIHLVMAGGYDPINVENLEHYKELTDLANRLKLNDKITFLRSPSDVHKLTLLSRSDAVVYTPSNEHFGIVPLEAMYFAKPVIAVNSGGPTETVIDNVTGFLCEPDEKMFASSIKKLILDPVLKSGMGKSGRERFRKTFSYDAFTTQLNDIVDSRSNKKSQ